MTDPHHAWRPDPAVGNEGSHTPFDARGDGGTRGAGPKRKTLIIAMSTLVCVLIVGSGAIGWAIGKSESSAGAQDSTSRSSDVKSNVGAAKPKAKPTAEPKKTLTPEDFSLDLTIVEKKCFGSAGCHVSYDLSPTYIGGTLDDLKGQKGRIVFEIVGGDDEQVENFTFDGEDIRIKDSYRVSTPSEDAVITAEVVQVIPQ